MLVHTDDQRALVGALQTHDRGRGSPKQQVQAENKARNSLDENEDIPYDWAVVSVKSQDIAQEIPMDPITCMRNALGKEEGGSGIPLDRTAYLKSVEFWKDHALIH